MTRSEHIEGLAVDRLTPADIEYFFRTLHPRVPQKASDEKQKALQELQVRLKDLAIYLGAPLAINIEISDSGASLTSICTRLQHMKRREWRHKKSGLSVLKKLRAEIGEISADLNEIAS